MPQKGETRGRPLPSITDFIFAVLAEQRGLAGCLVVLLVYFYLITRGFQIARDSTDLLASEVPAMLILGLLLNIHMRRFTY